MAKKAKKLQKQVNKLKRKVCTLEDNLGALVVSQDYIVEQLRCLLEREDISDLRTSVAELYANVNRLLHYNKQTTDTNFNTLECFRDFHTKQVELIDCQQKQEQELSEIHSMVHDLGGKFCLFADVLKRENDNNEDVSANADAEVKEIDEDETPF